MKTSERREAVKRVCEVRDATPETIAKYLQPSGGQRHAPVAPPVDALDKMMRTGSAHGSRPGSASIFAGGSRQGGRVACDSVWPDGASAPTNNASSRREQPAIFGGGKGGPLSQNAVWPDGPPPAAEKRAPVAPVAGRPRGAPTADPSGAAAEFAALGLGGLGMVSKGGGMPGAHAMMPNNGMHNNKFIVEKQPFYPLGYGQQPSAPPAYVAAMRAIPAAGAPRGPAKPGASSFRLG